MFSFNSQGKRLKNGNVEILIAIAIASIVCGKAKKNEKIRVYVFVLEGSPVYLNHLAPARSAAG